MADSAQSVLDTCVKENKKDKRDEKGDEKGDELVYGWASTDHEAFLIYKRNCKDWSLFDLKDVDGHLKN